MSDTGQTSSSKLKFRSKIPSLLFFFFFLFILSLSPSCFGRRIKGRHRRVRRRTSQSSMLLRSPNSLLFEALSQRISGNEFRDFEAEEESGTEDGCESPQTTHPNVSTNRTPQTTIYTWGNQLASTDRVAVQIIEKSTRKILSISLPGQDESERELLDLIEEMLKQLMRMTSSQRLSTLRRSEFNKLNEATDEYPSSTSPSEPASASDLESESRAEADSPLVFCQTFLKNLLWNLLPLTPSNRHKSAERLLALLNEDFVVEWDKPLETSIMSSLDHLIRVMRMSFEGAGFLALLPSAPSAIVKVKNLLISDCWGNGISTDNCSPPLAALATFLSNSGDIEAAMNLLLAQAASEDSAPPDIFLAPEKPSEPEAPESPFDFSDDWRSQSRLFLHAPSGKEIEVTIFGPFRLHRNRPLLY